MNLPIRVARRYLFSKKSTNAINIISGISIFGLSIGTAALILVLSVFNGFEDLITGLFSNFNPDVKIQPAEGKTFTVDSTQFAQIKNLDAVLAVSKTLEEVAIFEYKGTQDIGMLKGVDNYFNEVTQIDSTLRDGEYLLQDSERAMAVFGAEMYNKLSINVDDPFSAVTVYMAKRKKVGPLGNPFYKKYMYPAGVFSIQQDFNTYILTSLSFVQDLLQFKDEISYLEIKLDKNADQAASIAAIQNILGDQVIIKNRFQQDEAFLKLMNIEKWMSFAILSLTLLLVAFNLVGSLWMIVMEKKKDIAILQSMGADKPLIRNIFLSEGLLMCLLGIAIGFLLAIILYVVQKNFGIVPIPDGFVINSYPISMRFFDFLVVAITVITIGLLASFPPAWRAQRISAMVREQ